MLNVTEETKAVFKSDTASKEITIRIPQANMILHNEDILAESMTLKESIESSDNLSFIGCIASCFSFDCFDFVPDVRGMWIEADLQAEGAQLVPLFRGYIDDATNLTHEDFTKRITAYDALYKVNNADVTSWWKSLPFPITCKQLRDSFFNYFGITQEIDFLPNDQVVITNTIEDEIIKGETVLKAICQLNGRFGQINRYGVFTYRHLMIGTEALYPREDLYPKDDLFPSDENALDSISKGHYTAIEYENYQVQPITGVKIINKDDEVGAAVGNSSNYYTVASNPLVYGLTEAQLRNAAQNLFNTIFGLWYVPAKVNSVGLPYVECGDFVLCATRRSIVRTYVLSRTLSGVQILTDAYDAPGDYRQPVYTSSHQSTITAALKQETERATNSEKTLTSNLNKEINNRVEAVNGAYSQIQQTATQIRTEVSNADNTLNSRITQTATEIRSEVNDTARGLSSRIEQNAYSITLQATEINLKADRTYVDNLIASRATISQLNATNARVSSLESKRSFTGAFYASSITCDGATFTKAKTINTFNSAGKYLGQVTVLATD